ncbi:MAG TPA: glycerophosphodiester phosphodiesterase family protein [Gemmataceae bacterium]|nr:glycerophosphodiester phosphodiesterase family protein [Gemmataceae bacterium]
MRRMRMVWTFSILTALIGSAAAQDGKPNAKTHHAAAAARKVRQVIGHQGSCGDRPGNTLASFRRAIEAGATIGETDVRTTRDGKLVCCHDADVSRTTNGKGLVRDRTLAEINKLDAGSWFDAKYKGERVPTLPEVLQLCKGKMHVMLDLKESGDEYARHITAEVRKHGEPKEIVLGVRSVEHARLFRKLLPEARQIALIPRPDDIEAFAEAGVATIRLWPDWLKDRTLVPRVRKLKCQLHLHAPKGTKEEVLALLPYEPESLSSDYPGRLLHTLSDIKKPQTGKGNPNVHRRGSLTNARLQFEKKKVGHVVFVGGSITEMNGYRPLVCDYLRKRFPQTELTFTNAGIASTCSTTGAFRLATDVLDKGPVDLLFVEFAVNDDQDAGHARRECIRGMEGIVRHLWKHNPNADIVITYFVNPAMLKALQEGKEPLPIASHEKVARRYGISSVHLAKEVADRVQAGTLTWKEYGGVHPARPGNQLAAALIEELLSAAWEDALPADAALVPHPMPEQPLDTNHYGNGRFIDPKHATLGTGWKVEVPEWKKLRGQCRERFRDVPLLCATEPGAELTLTFEGKAVGAYVLAGPDAGKVEAAVDDGAFARIDLFHAFSRGLHYPRTVMFAADLKPGKHTLKLRIAGQKNKASSGHAVRILQFVAN